jgi:hypothetical protein
VLIAAPSDGERSLYEVWEFIDTSFWQSSEGPAGNYNPKRNKDGDTKGLGLFETWTGIVSYAGAADENRLVMQFSGGNGNDENKIYCSLQAVDNIEECREAMSLANFREILRKSDQIRIEPRESITDLRSIEDFRKFLGKKTMKFVSSKEANKLEKIYARSQIHRVYLLKNDRDCASINLKNIKKVLLDFGFERKSLDQESSDQNDHPATAVDEFGDS